ncbi:hypothetical protein FACS1894187_19990 [Synergistales bacterium]|nr:hypothetical protein FACS1894187_19990 [Synergistales bacterium]
MSNDKNLQMPQVNVVPMEWTHNHLIPIALKEFNRKGFAVLASIAGFAIICSVLYWVAGSIRNDYERNIFLLQNNIAKTLAKHTATKDHVQEMSQLANWRSSPDIATQYSAISAILVRNNCYLTQSVFYSGVKDAPEKTLSSIRPEIERITKTKLDSLNVIGVWNLSIRLSMSGLNTNEVRKNIISSLQKDTADSLKPAKSAFILSDEQGQSMLKNDSALNVTFLIWG